MAKIGIVFAPCWGVSHFEPMIEAAKRLLLTPSGGRFSVTILLVNPPPESARSFIRSLASSGLDLTFHDIPPSEPRLVRGPPDITSFYADSRAAVRAAVSDLLSSVPVAALVFDVFGAPLIDVARDLNVAPYIYFASTAALLALFLHLPTLDEKFSGVEFEEMVQDVVVPGVFPIPPQCIPTPLMDKKGRGYSCFIDNARRYQEARGILLNTVEELEPAPLAAIRAGLCLPDGAVTPPVHPIGPIIAGYDEEAGEKVKDEYIRWLDDQPPASVVFLCFGSVRGLDVRLAREAAVGLERSGQRFLWSLLRSSPISELLPEGFEERTRDRGLVWPGWVSQKAVLAHPAVGGFVSHCGWNSCVESMWYGVTVLPWPQYAEQHMNALVLVNELGVAVAMRVERGDGNFVSAEELERGLRCLMGEDEKGKRVRAKMAEVSAASRRATGEGGSSCVNLARVAEEMANAVDAEK